MLVEFPVDTNNEGQPKVSVGFTVSQYPKVLVSDLVGQVVLNPFVTLEPIFNT